LTFGVHRRRIIAHYFKNGLFITLLLLGSLNAYAQVKKSPRSSSFSVPKVNSNKARIMCPIFVNSRYPYQGIGFKLGDPFALTYKFYANNHFAFAVDVGKAASGLYNKYYRDAFHTYLPDTLHKGQSIQYLAHKAVSDLFIETKFLYQWDAEKISKGLQFYAGFGWQWRNTDLQYDYNVTDRILSANDGKFGSFTQTRFTYGPVVLVGFELFTDALLDPGYQRFQGGTGLRYVF
jgi:hypothetical protein